MATRTFTVTVVGGKYVIDGVSQATLTLAEDATYKFDQADSSNGSHPLRFSTTSDGSHGGGSEYTTGVTTNGTPGQAGAYTQITVAASAPTLYYYCTNHSGMGGQADTVDADTWGVLTWGVNSWASDVITQSITGNEITSSQGDAVAYPDRGWGAQSYSTGEWGEVNENTVTLTGLSITSSLNADGVDSFPNTGWGRAQYGEQPWGESNNPVVSVSGYSITSAQGDAIAFPEQGWGKGPQGWGEENWGESGIDVSLTGFEIGTIESGQGGWGTVAYGEASWGMWTLTPADAVGLSGQSITASQGTTSIQVDYVDTPTGLSITASQGTGWSINNGADIAVGLGTQSFSASVGAISPADVVGLTGVQFSASVGSVGTGSQEIISLTGLSFSSNIGSVTVADMAVGLTGQSFTGSVGSITPADVVGLTGVEFSANVGELYPVYFKDVDIESSAGYEDVDIEGSTTYTDVNIAA